MNAAVTSEGWLAAEAWHEAFGGAGPEGGYGTPDDLKAVIEASAEAGPPQEGGG